MGRYGPQYAVQDHSGELLAQALEQAGANVVGGIERGRERRRQAQLDADAATDRRIRLYDAGVRDGRAPSGDVTLPGLEVQPAPAFPSGSELARHLSIGGTPAPEDAGSGAGLAAALPAGPITTNQPRTFDPGFGAARPAPVAGHPGAFDPATNSFRDGKGMPKATVLRNPDRYAQLDDAHYLDRTQTPEARQETAQIHGKELERELATQERERRVGDLMAAYHIPREKALALIDIPALADNDLFPKNPPTVPNADKISARIKELTAGGKMTLAEANKQARLEFGETNPQDTSSKQSMQMMQRVLSLQGHFNSDRSFTQAQDIASAYQKITQAAAGEHTATSDMSLVYGLMKMQDPGSTVREGEYASAENAKGIPDSIKNLYNKAIDGAILSDRQRQQFAQTAESLARAHRKVFAGTLKRYSDMATRYEVDPRDVVFDPFEGVLTPEKPIVDAGKKPGNPWRQP